MSSMKRCVNEKHKNYLFFLAYVYLNNSQPEKAIVIYKALWYLYPESENIAFCLGYLYFNTGQFDIALYYVDSYLNKKHSALGYFLKAQILLKLGRQPEAEEAIRQFLDKPKS
jgi:tetratricopeptide (TPR) repeat protein